MSAQVLPEPRHVRQLLLVSGGGLELGELACLLNLDPMALSRVMEQGQQRGHVLLVTREQPLPSGPRLLLEGPGMPVATGEKMALATSAVRLCQERAGSCKGLCGNLHLCRFFVFGNCRNNKTRNPCRFIHDINFDLNHRALDIHGLHGLNEDQLRLLLLQNDPALLPEPCVHYNRGDGPFGSCTFKKSCAKLHICIHFLQGNCRFGSTCKRSHNLLEGETVDKMEKWGLSSDLIRKMPAVYRNSFDIRNSSYSSQSTESATFPGPLTRSRSVDEGSEEICLFHIRKRCGYQEKCNKVHFHLPYRWQVFTGGAWNDMKDMELAEKKYCDPNCSAWLPELDLKQMIFRASKVRRLSTVSSAVKPPHFIFTTEWLWYWKDEFGGWNEYGKMDQLHHASTIGSSDLEKAYLEDGSSTVQFKAGKHEYELSFKDMVQRNLHYKTEREVCRRPKFVSQEDVQKLKTKRTEPTQEGSIPSYWDKSQLPDVGYKHIHLADTSEEYKKVQTLFQRTLMKPVILSIERIQNPSLWKVYQWQKEQMEKANDGKVVDERHLFHGTDEKLVDSISSDNFDWRICGVHGTAYGKGSYFARDAAYSHSYSKLTSSETRIMFVARVLVGNFVRGKGEFLRPPGKIYNSCVDSVSDPSIFVVFEKHQIYPEYLVKYTDKPPALNIWGSVRSSLK
ncbi:protein mono-ADP-ribosyltransferase PARP12-like [Ambystoma mexicanum]|uniref:protein mono-ADP-ribosyltransferase PARP12-like n=1 Tax=Ambystoma mexicanum TaxID=8296 RepID=UPI0037E8E92E